MGRDRAAYMREYRARQRPRVCSTMDELADATNVVMARQASRIAELEEEVRHLKAELAKRPVPHTYSSRPFTPVPKQPSKSPR